MSFWTFLGLPDANDIRALHNDITQLYAENAQLKKQVLSIEATLKEQHARELETISNAFQAIADAQEKNAVELAAIQTSLGGYVDTIEKAATRLGRENKHINDLFQCLAEDVPDIKSYLNSLWEAIKLVWINDLLDSISSEEYEIEEKPEKVQIQTKKDLAAVSISDTIRAILKSDLGKSPEQ